MVNKNKTQSSIRRQKRQRERFKTNVGLLIGGGVALIIFGFLIQNAFFRTPLGDSVPATGSGVHLPEGQPLPPYSTNPPTSGPHFTNTMPEGFYDETSPEATGLPNPQGYLVHNLEHGYVIFWYNCAGLSPAGCGDLKTGIQTAMGAVNNFKVIAFPWPPLDVAVVATSWGRMLVMESFDPELAAQFIQRNRNRAPEPNAR